MNKNTTYQLNDHPLHQAVYDLSQQIEKCGASTELTNAVIMAGDLQSPIADLLNQYNSLSDLAKIRGQQIELKDQYILGLRNSINQIIRVFDLNPKTEREVDAFNAASDLLE